MSAVAAIPVLVVLVLIGCGAWVYQDAGERAARGRPVVLSLGSFELATPAAWAVACVLLWLIFFPLYLGLRGATG